MELLLRPEMKSCFAHRRAVGFLNKAVFFITCTKQPTTARFLLSMGNTLAELTLASADA